MVLMISISNCESTRARFFKMQTAIVSKFASFLHSPFNKNVLDLNNSTNVTMVSFALFLSVYISRWHIVHMLYVDFRF